MREILFKAKRIDNGEWVEGTYHYADWVYPQTMKFAFRMHSILPISGEDAYEVDENTLCQYTGLKNKYGMKIWENDVVRYYDGLANMDKEDLIKWNETHASFTRLHKSKMGLQYLYIDECIANGCEVIGNIFDNPELLKGGKDEIII